MYLRTSCMVLLTVAATAFAARSATGHGSYFTNQCAGCHTNDNPTCIGCHHHGGSPSAPTTNKTQYAPGETVTVTMNGSTRQAWARAILYNQDDQEIARITGPTDVGCGFSQMRLRSETLAWSAWQPFAATKTWTLVAGRGTKTVSVQFRDGAGNVSNIYSDTIVLNMPGQTAAARWELFR